jgi:hypothetical protein
MNKQNTFPIHSKQAISLPNTFNVNNSPQHITDLRQLEIQQNTGLASFDISNMYTSIPILHLREIIENSLMNNLVDTQQIQEILKIYDLVTSQNYFSHVDGILHQNDGLAMGAPSSAILSEVFLQYIEEIFITDILIQNKIIGYFRYVDDTLIIYDQIMTYFIHIF